MVPLKQRQQCSLGPVVWQACPRGAKLKARAQFSGDKSMVVFLPLACPWVSGRLAQPLSCGSPSAPAVQQAGGDALS